MLYVVYIYIQSGVRAQRDPIDRVKNLLLELNWSTGDDLKKIEKDVRTLVDANVEHAKQAQELPIDQVSIDVYRGGNITNTHNTQGEGK